MAGSMCWVFLLVHIEFATIQTKLELQAFKRDEKFKGSVFTVKAKGRMTKGSSIDIEKRLGIKEGRGKHFVEFDASPSEVTVVTNPITGATEHIFSGDVLLDNRNPIFSPL